MSTTLNTRVQSKRDTSANWTQNNPILLDGEVIIVDTNSGDVRFKIGDGVSTYTQLPFQDEYVLNQIPNVSEYVTAQEPEGIVDTIPPTFDGYTSNDFVLKTNVVDSLNSTETNLPLSANQGNILNQSINTLSSSLTNKLNISGGNLTGMLIANNNSNYAIGQVRNIFISSEEPTNDQGNNGDIWLVYGG